MKIDENTSVLLLFFMLFVGRGLSFYLDAEGSVLILAVRNRTLTLIEREDDIKS
jgi:hypothetical protein